MKSFPEIYKQLKYLASRISQCNFIPEIDKEDIIGLSSLKVLNAHNQGKLVDDFNETKGYTFMILRNCCLQYKKNKKIIEFYDWIDDVFVDDTHHKLYDDEEYKLGRELLVKHSRFYKFTDIQRRYVELLTQDYTKDDIKTMLNLNIKDYKSLSLGVYHRMKAAKNRKYRYVSYDVDNPDDYILYETTHSVVKSYNLTSKTLQDVIKDKTIINNKIISKYEK
jgi:hypothetical protein